ncbi:CopD family protein [Paracraurococcus lichenis]|uniref:CopD family protein n=1 Tax=Paracraurococcus lichenis TaxID=3064888 RepID=A0ABT9DSB2_9PROT|nr:CopD family protein [Paracraurococcus sp. LOR1-02]MDO9706789.1 CopD family protein [Paracraurococcus sp. LOR1-02]
MLGKLLYVLHLLGAVLWVGGMAFALLALRPALAALEPPQRLLVHEGALRRFFLIVWHAMPVLLLTGYALLFGWYGGFAGAGWHIHAMHLTAIIMAGVFVALFTGPWKEFRAAQAAGDRPKAATAMDRIRQLVAMNLGLGLLTVAASAWGRFGG